MTIRFIVSPYMEAYIVTINDMTPKQELIQIPFGKIFSNISLDCNDNLCDIIINENTTLINIDNKSFEQMSDKTPRRPLSPRQCCRSK